METVATLFEEIFDNLDMMETSCKFSELVNPAVKENITVYDAAYLYVSRKYKYKLVTGNHDLKHYPEAFNVRRLLEELFKEES